MRRPPPIRICLQWRRDAEATTMTRLLLAALACGFLAGCGEPGAPPAPKAKAPAPSAEPATEGKKVLVGQNVGKEWAGRWGCAGSILYKASDEPNAPMKYGANEGDVIAIANFDTAMLDVPFKSSKDEAALGFEAWTERIPPKGTKVVLVLTPLD